MDKKAAIEFLKERLCEISNLKMLPPSNNEYLLWFNNIKFVLEDVFGKDSSEYTEFVNIKPLYGSNMSESRFYNNKLNNNEIAILSILKKYETLGIDKKPEKASEPPKAFIVHGGRSGGLDKLRDFIEALGIRPLIVEMLPSKGMTLVDKVKKYQREADCAIILATRGGIIDTKSGKQHPRLNVIDELSSFYQAFPERIVILLEKGAELPSNKSGLTYEPFARQSMDRAFTAIARELVEMKIIKAVKPQTREQTP